MCTMLYHTAKVCPQACLVPASVKACMLPACATLITPHLNAIPAQSDDTRKEMDSTTPVSVQDMQGGSVRTAVLEQTTTGSVESGKQRRFATPGLIETAVMLAGDLYIDLALL